MTAHPNSLADIAVDPADLWDAYCEETPAAGRTPQGAIAFAVDRLRTPAPVAQDREAYPSVEAMKAAVELEIHAALGSVKTVVIGQMIQRAIDATHTSSDASTASEPVAWRYQRKEGWGDVWRTTTVLGNFETPGDWTVQPLYAAPPALGVREALEWAATVAEQAAENNAEGDGDWFTGLRYGASQAAKQIAANLRRAALASQQTGASPLPSADRGGEA